MDIQRTRPGALNVDRKTTDPSRSAQTAPGDATPAKADAAPTDASRLLDRVELSNAARAQSSSAPPAEVQPEEVDQIEEAIIERAHEMLRDWPTLDPERLEMIRGRIEDGFYGRPESLRQIAEGLAADFSVQGSPQK